MYSLSCRCLDFLHGLSFGDMILINPNI
jgi:hypothetical protein